MYSGNDVNWDSRIMKFNILYCNSDAKKIYSIE